jgi:translation initiation factor IF-2
MKQLGVQVRLHDIIYHAIDDIKLLMAAQLDKLAVETEKGTALVKATFKSSHAGIIAGCQVTDGSITRNNHIRIKRGGEVVWKGTISTLKRVKEDVREVQKGLECGITFNNFTEVAEGDMIEAYDVTYIAQEL